MKNYPQVLTVGIAARNEENTIKSCLNSIIESSSNFPVSTEIEIIITLNGCNDRTEQVVGEYINSYNGKDVSFSVYYTSEGQINAQRKIWASRKSKDFVIFIDADTIIDKNCLSVLADTMTSDHKVEIAWARCLPYRKAKNRGEFLYNLLDYYHDMRKEQNYFTGRVFAVRNYEIPRSGGIVHSAFYNLLNNYLQLDHGPMIDDVFLSRSILYHKGAYAVKQCVDAIVYFNPITNMVDFYLSQRRTALECKRLDILFPEHSKRTKPYYRARLPNSLKQGEVKLYIYYTIYMYIKYLSRFISFLEFHFNRYLCYFRLGQKPCNIWPTILSSKNPFNI